MIFDLKNTIIASYFEARQTGNTVELLPVGHSKHFPLAFDISSREISKGEVNFYNSVFHKNFSAGKLIASSQCEAVLHKATDTIRVMNLLDNCFGHSLLKLFQAVKLISENKATDHLIIVPKALRHFLRPGKGLSLLVVNYSFNKLEGCFILNDEIAKITGAYARADYQGVDTYGEFDSEIIKTQLNLIGDRELQSKQKSIVFYYRSDYYRMWGGKKQKKHIVALFDFLRPYFKSDTRFIVVGDRDEAGFPRWIDDRRITGFSDQADWEYNALFANALICIGLTGSHMLFPSIFCETTVHLHNTIKYKNMAEDTVPTGNGNEIMNAYRHLYYFGNNNCSDLPGKQLGTMILLHFQGYVEKRYKITCTEPAGQSDWIKTNYPFFDYAGVTDFRKKFNAQQNQKTRMRYYLQKLVPFI